ncbi:MAG: metal-sensing transcriptional repressor [Gammaproteobacteria bacterium]|nr:metal-sensing transcriptional repressor [Gammaproteobacteria bacterium]
MTDSANATTLAQHKRNMIVRLRRVEGQLRGIQGMIDADAGCEAVAQQLAAARRALDRAFYEMVACSMEAELEVAGDLTSAKAAGAHVAKILAKYG